MKRILVVDDEEDLEVLIRQKFRRQIREQIYEFIFTLNGIDALSKLQEYNDIDIVLSDINMPEMDGLTLLGKISESYPLTKVIMVSAYGDMDNIRTAMNRGAFDFVTKPINFEDLEMTMQKTFTYVNYIRESFETIRENNILKMYVDKNVLSFMRTKEFEESLNKNISIESSVAFIDICGFTIISEKEPANTVVTMLNKYFDMMVNEIIIQNGIIDKFMGDCIMAVFKGDYHLDRAIEACISIRDKIKSLEEENNFKPQVSIGINSGEVVSGNIGSVTLKRLDYTIIGDVVNIAQRLQSIAEPNQILIIEECYHKVKQSFKCNFIGEKKFKNKKDMYLTYEVIH